MTEPPAKRKRQDVTKSTKSRIIRLLKEQPENIEFRDIPSYGKPITGLDFKISYIHEKDEESGKFYCNPDLVLCKSDFFSLQKMMTKEGSYVIQTY